MFFYWKVSVVIFLLNKWTNTQNSVISSSILYIMFWAATVAIYTHTYKQCSGWLLHAFIYCDCRTYVATNCNQSFAFHISNVYHDETCEAKSFHIVAPIFKFTTMNTMKLLAVSNIKIDLLSLYLLYKHLFC